MSFEPNDNNHLVVLLPNRDMAKRLASSSEETFRESTFVVMTMILLGLQEDILTAHKNSIS